MTTLFVGDACLNDCLICGVEDAPGMKFYNIGGNEVEDKALENLIKSVENDYLDISGGDPLFNKPVLRSIAKNHKGDKAIVLNPISFLTMELKKRATNLTEEDYSALVKKVETEGLSENTKETLAYLLEFDGIALSSGNLQSPNPDVMDWALSFFNTHIKPSLISVQLADYSLDATFEEGGTISDAESIACVGKARTSIENRSLNFENVKTGKLPEERDDDFQYGSDCRKGGYKIYFQREGESIRMNYMMCCTPGVTGYTSFRSELTVEDLAVMKPEAIIDTITAEYTEHKDSVLHNMLNFRKVHGRNGPYQNDLGELLRGDEVPAKPTTIEKYHSSTAIKIGEFFPEYVAEAEKLILEKTGKQVSVADNTYTTQKDTPRLCEACFTVGYLLNEAGIKPDEWHNHLETEFGRK
jgi:hypothetical protein